MKVFLIGAGPGHEKWLTLEAREVLRAASLVVATPRLYAQLGHLNARTVSRPVGELLQTVVSARGEHESVAVLVSGDTGFFSVAKGLMEKFARYQDMEVSCLNGLNSLQYLCGKLGVAYEKAKIVSLHGREGSILPFVAYNPLVFALSGGSIKAHTVINSLVEAGLGDVEIAAGENLSSPDERILTGTADSLRHKNFADLTSLVIRNEACVNPHDVLRDDDFIRGGVPMTKQAVRSVSLAALNIQPDDCLWDIGAGTGSVSIAMARQAHEGMVYAIERKGAALELIRKNRERHSAYNVNIVEGSAPECLAGLPVPDKVFIGGSGGELSEIADMLKGLNPRVTIVVTAISLETVQEALSIFKRDSSQGSDAVTDTDRRPAVGLGGTSGDGFAYAPQGVAEQPPLAVPSAIAEREPEAVAEEASTEKGDAGAGKTPVQRPDSQGSPDCALKTASGAKQKEPAVEIMCLNAAVSDRVGGYHLMKAENPVYIIKGHFL